MGRFFIVIGKIFLVLSVLIAIVISYFFYSIGSGDDERFYNVSGIINTDKKDSSGSTYFEYYSKEVTATTDAIGNYLIEKPNELFIEIKKEGYQHIQTSITDYSDLGRFKFKEIELNKSKDTTTVYRKLSFEKEGITQKQTDLTGSVKDIFGNPVSNVLVTLTDKKNTSVSFDENFDFNRNSYFINFEKKGYEKLSIRIDEKNDSVYNSNDITLVKKRNKKGVYLVQSGKLLALPRTKLKYDSEERFNSILWGGRYGYNVNTFYFPKGKKKFKIAKKEMLRFIIFDDSYKHLFEVIDESENYICYSDHKYSVSSYPRGQNLGKKTYPYENNKSKTNYIIIDFTSAADFEGEYVFVSSKTKKGYYFTN